MSQEKERKKKQPEDEVLKATNEVPNEAVEETVEETPGEDLVQKELGETKDLLLRTAAEYENFKRRSKQEKEDSYAFAVISTVGALLPAIDNFERAATADTPDEDYKKGCLMILDQFKAALSKLGISEMDCENKPFNPDEHNAVMHIEDEAFPENTVAEVLQKGYKLGDRVVRHAMVKVAN